ncbi:STAS domain-containing protein [Priestia megaterium]|jgi:rsbT co-antagonist protein RsbR|uniref:STAS domain-containing protein n=1 Tax=Priestia megaterium TaxID=1404 RepID=UPI00244982AC|nr:STAS domain-containing protein [Priestia megaterium]MDH2363882.1 STAS domain-containing protein [Priestia megaterium]
MKEELQYIGEKIVKNNAELANNLSELMYVEYNQKLHQYGIEEYQIMEWRTKLIQYIGESLFKDQKTVTEKITNLATYIGKTIAENGISLKHAIKSISFVRHVIWNVFTEELEQNRFSPITMLSVSKIIDPFLDDICYVFSQIYENQNNKKINIVYTALEELSVPIVPITTGIAVMPIIGEIDTHRSTLIIQTGLAKSVHMELSHLILDISGVQIVDTMVADNLFKLIYSLRLLGVETILTGIRPEIAQTSVKLGIDFRKINTKATLEQALEEIGFRRVLSK